MKRTHIHKRASLIVLAISLTACGHPEQKFAITVTDESGKPVEGIECKAWFKKPGQNSPVKDYFIKGKTDHSGKTELVGSTMWGPTSVEASKDGCYPSTAGDHWTVTRNAGRWEPWPVEVKLVMKKIENPKPMYVVKFDNQKWHRFPDKNLGPIGFDLMSADWVQPYGKGKISDFILEAKRENEDDPGVMPKGEIVLTFSNPGDGISFREDVGGSELCGPAIIPEDATFHPRWVFQNFKTREQKPAQLGNDLSNEVYVFRVRTRLDEKGAVESTHYGKIDGRIVGWLPKAAPSILMTYYLNGTPNDRGLEWDMKTNLIEDTSRMRIPERP
jgi:hypothetical protein